MSEGARVRLCVVSHPAVVATNQTVFAELASAGVSVELITPNRWRHAYAASPFAPATLPGLVGHHHQMSVMKAGSPQRHLYRRGLTALLRRLEPTHLYIEEECFSVPALQWALVATRLRIPFGVQAWENLDRPLPLPARLIRKYVLSRARFIVARTPAAAERVEEWGTRALVAVIPSPVPTTEQAPRHVHDGFVVGAAGRIVAEKNLLQLADAVAHVEGATLVVAGDGPLAPQLMTKAGVSVERGMRHEDMAAFFARCDVVALVSVPTTTWAEQFGRVLVEALAQGTPVVGSTCGEIPWVIAETGGGVVVPAGDLEALVAALEDFAKDPGYRSALGAAGRQVVLERFSCEAAARGLLNLLSEVESVR